LTWPNECADKYICIICYLLIHFDTPYIGRFRRKGRGTGLPQICRLFPWSRTQQWLSVLAKTSNLHVAPHHHHPFLKNFWIHHWVNTQQLGDHLMNSNVLSIIYYEIWYLFLVAYEVFDINNGFFLKSTIVLHSSSMMSFVMGIESL
jgi:hypothetical protein